MHIFHRLSDASCEGKGHVLHISRLSINAFFKLFREQKPRFLWQVASFLILKKAEKISKAMCLCAKWQSFGGGDEAGKGAWSQTPSLYV